MKKEMSVLFIIVVILGVACVSAQLIKPSKIQYHTGESVYVLSSVSANDVLCRANTNEQVKLFIVEHKENWGGGESLSDVRDDSSDIPNKKFASKKVWESISKGTYDLVVDCDDNENYNSGEPLYKEGFSVVVKQGSGSIILGNQKDFSWQYDAEDGEVSVVVLPVTISAVNENIAIRNLSLRVINSVVLDIDAIEVYVDGNANGKADSDDTLIGTARVSEGLAPNAVVNIPLDHTISAEASENLLIVYTMKEQSADGKYRVELLSV
ncbi:MAG: hypothetical protein RL557_207, partial [archaeon]